MTPISHGPNIWSIPHSHKVAGLLPLGTRTTIVRLHDGALLLHSPGPLSAEELEHIRQMGDVRVLFAPNLEHVLFLDVVIDAFPDAELWGPTALDASKDHLDHHQDISDPPWKGALVAIAVKGVPRLQETVFIHPESRSLIFADLSFNIQSADGWFNRLMLRMAGAYGTFGPSHLFKGYFLSDRAAFKASLDQILQHDFDQVILAHGDVVAEGGKDGLRDAFAFLD
ncbi:MAG: hypothetical protein AAFV53_33000 [Myxococcota bacterium]